MPDAFFQSTKNRKRKRPANADHGPSTSKKPARAAPSKKRPGQPTVRPKGRKRDEELSDATQDEDEGAGVDEMDLRAPDVDPNAYESGEEDEQETEAEKRLRLAKLYIQGVKEGLSLGACWQVSSSHELIRSFYVADGEFDAAEIDRELISARLKQDVMEHSGKVYLFVVDSVRGFSYLSCIR